MLKRISDLIYYNSSIVANAVLFLCISSHKFATGGPPIKPPVAYLARHISRILVECNTAHSCFPHVAGASFLIIYLL